MDALNDCDEGLKTCRKTKESWWMTQTSSKQVHGMIQGVSTWMSRLSIMYATRVLMECMLLLSLEHATRRKRERGGR